MEEKVNYIPNQWLHSSHAMRYHHLGRRIAKIRKARKLSQHGLAKKVGVSRSYVSKIECGNALCGVSLEILLNIARGLRVEPSFLFRLRPQDLSTHQAKASDIVRIKHKNLD